MRNLMKIVISMSIVAGLAGGSLADDKAKPAPPAQPPAKPTTPPAKPTPPAPPPITQAPPAMPTPAAEVAAFVKANTGTWKCTGKLMMPDGTSMDIKATMKTKFGLDKFWAQMSYAETKKNGYKFEAYRSFDGKKWHSVTVDNMGGSETTSSDGPKEGKLVWTGSSRGMMGDHLVRHTEEPVGTAGKEMKAYGEHSMDKGKTWAKGYEVVCKK